MAARRVGKYLILSSLGEGTFGKVKLAVHEDTGEQFALKIMDKTDIIEASFTIYVRREIAIMKALTHRNIVKLHHVLTSDHKLYLVMEAVNGGELWGLLSRAKNGVPESLARFFFRQLVDGVGYCHRRGVVHRDLKLENVLITSQGEVKIVDFGLSAVKSAGKSNELLTTACGTPNYISPEVLVEGRNKGYDGKKLDVWSCGIILYALVCGYLPFERKCQKDVIRAIGNEEVSFPDWVSEGVKDLIGRMLEKNPKKRINLHHVKRHAWFMEGCLSLSPASTPGGGGGHGGQQHRRQHKAKTRRRKKQKNGRAKNVAPPALGENPKSRSSGNRPVKKKPRTPQPRRPRSSDDDLRQKEDRKLRNKLVDGFALNQRHVGALRYYTNERERFADRTLGGVEEARRKGLLGVNSTLVLGRVDSDFDTPPAGQDSVSEGVGKIRRIQTMLAISKRGPGGKEVDSKNVFDVLLGKIEGLHMQEEAAKQGGGGRQSSASQHQQQTLHISPSFLLDQAPGGKDAFIDALRYVRDRLKSEVNGKTCTISKADTDGARELLDLWEENLASPSVTPEGQDHNRNCSQAGAGGKRKTVQVQMDWVIALQKLLKSWDQAVVGDDSAAEELDDNGTGVDANVYAAGRRKVGNDHDDEFVSEDYYSTELDSDYVELDDIPGMVNVGEEVRLYDFSRSNTSSTDSRGSHDAPAKPPLNVVGEFPKTESHQLREKNGVNELSFMNRMVMLDVKMSGFVSTADLKIGQPRTAPPNISLSQYFTGNTFQRSPDAPTVYTSTTDSENGDEDPRKSNENARYELIQPKKLPAIEVAPIVSFDDIEGEFLGRERDEYVEAPPTPKSMRRKSSKPTSPSHSSRGILRRSSRGSRGTKSPSGSKLSSDPASPRSEGRSSLRWLSFSGARNTAQFDSFLQPEPCLNMLGQMLQKGGCDVHQKRDELKLKCHVVLRQGRMSFTIDFYGTDVGGTTVVFKRIDKTFNRSLDSNTFKKFFDGVVTKFSTVNTIRPPAISAP